MNERITESIVRKRLVELNYKFDEQIASDPRIKRALKSKSGKNGQGFPEFILDELWNPRILIIIECKPDTKKHESPEQNKPKEYAVDGVLHYANSLVKDGYCVIAIAVSGCDENNMMISTFYCKDNEVVDYTALTSEILSAPDYYKLLNPIESDSVDKVLAAAKSLHNYLRDNIKLTEDEKPKIVAGCLIALNDPVFLSGYRSSLAGGTLSSFVCTTVETQLNASGMPHDKIGAIMSEISFARHHKGLNTGNNLKDFIISLEKDVFPYAKHDRDVVGLFYGEFLRYVGGDGKGLGIVLTPKHITELFWELVGLTKDSIVLDTCCGTGGFLISAMSYMLSKATTEEQRVNIRKNQLIGVEQAPKMYVLAAANMFLRGDGKANLYLGSCFDKDITKDIKDNRKPNVCLLNPPYSQKSEGTSELHFIKHSLDLLQPNGLCVAIVPMSCGIKPSQTKKELLAKHTLEACINMNPALFYKVGTHTMILIFRAHAPHNPERPTYIADWSDDGFISVKNMGRQDINNAWESKKGKFLSDYFAKREVPGVSVVRCLSAEDEWVIQAYLDTDYSKLTEKDFQRVLLKRMLFESGHTDMLNYILEGGLIGLNPSSKELKVETWKEFEISNLFDLENGKGTPTKDNGLFPIVTSTTENNGIDGYTSETSNIVNAPAITISIRGGGNAFYQDKDFSPSLNALALKPKFSLNKQVGLFLCVILNQSCFKYSYGRIRTMGRVLEEKIKLPTTIEGTPDWGFIEDYMEEITHGGKTIDSV